MQAFVVVSQPTLMNRISIIDSWSKLEEVIRFLHYRPWNQQKLMIKEHLESLGTHKPGEKNSALKLS